eukprot:507425_1
MLDSGIIPVDPRKVHGSLHEKQATLSEVLNDRASKEFLKRTKILKYDKIDASIQPMADDLEHKLNTQSPGTTRLIQLQQQGIIPSDNVAPSLAGKAKQLDKQIKTDKLSQSLNSENRKTKNELTESGVMKYSNLSNNLITAANKLETQVKNDILNKNMRNRPDVNELAKQNIINTNVDASIQQTQNQLKMQKQKDKLTQNLRNREDIDKLHDQNIITPNIAPQYAAKQRELNKQKKKRYYK